MGVFWEFPVGPNQVRTSWIEEAFLCSLTLSKLPAEQQEADWVSLVARFSCIFIFSRLWENTAFCCCYFQGWKWNWGVSVGFYSKQIKQVQARQGSSWSKGDGAVAVCLQGWTGHHLLSCTVTGSRSNFDPVIFRKLIKGENLVYCC